MTKLQRRYRQYLIDMFVLILDELIFIAGFILVVVGNNLTNDPLLFSGCGLMVLAAIILMGLYLFITYTKRIDKADKEMLIRYGYEGASIKEHLLKIGYVQDQSSDFKGIYNAPDKHFTIVVFEHPIDLTDCLKKNVIDQKTKRLTLIKNEAFSEEELKKILSLSPINVCFMNDSEISYQFDGVQAMLHNSLGYKIEKELNLTQLEPQYNSKNKAIR